MLEDRDPGVRDHAIIPHPIAYRRVRAVLEILEGLSPEDQEIAMGFLHLWATKESMLRRQWAAEQLERQPELARILGIAPLFLLIALGNYLITLLSIFGQ